MNPNHPSQRPLLLCICALLAVGLAALPQSGLAQDTSAPAFLQMFEAKWDVVEDRMADIFVAGYGRMWLPPPARADSGGLSVGYDVFDRFDLGGRPGHQKRGSKNSDNHDHRTPFSM